MTRLSSMLPLCQTSLFALLLTATLLFVAPDTVFGAALAPLADGPIADITAISAGEYHACALTSNGGVKCWGRNSSGQLGDDTELDSSLPVNVRGLTAGVAAVSAGDFHTCALTTDGGVKCWGGNNSGQLGDGTNENSTTPVDVTGLASGVVALHVGADHACALTDSDGVKCWGDNFYGQLGNDDTENSTTPVDVSGLTSGVASIGTGGNHTCALTTGGDVKCWGWNDDGQLGDGTNIGRTAPVDVNGLGGEVTAITAGGRHTCALMADGGVQCWGRNFEEQLGDGTSNDSSTPVDVVGLTEEVATIHAGPFHTCAITSAGGLQCWGWNDDGQLGDDTTTDRNMPVDVLGLSSNVTAVSAGYQYTCALITGGGVKCWGANDDGQLGNDSTEDSLTPVDVLTGIDALVGIQAISAGNDHTCGVTETGGVMCWGANLRGQLGDGTNMTRTMPTAVSGLAGGVSAVALGGTHSCAVTNGGGVKCWGSNGGGWLGDGTRENRNLPVDVSGLGSGVASVSAGEFHTCAVTGAGGVKCWGSNTFGQLGTTERSDTPVDVPGLTSGVAAVSAGYAHTCALTTSGGVKCWGWNIYGQLGEGSTDDSDIPVDVSGLTSGVAAITTGRYHTCALTTAGAAKCWGRNGEAQLGVSGSGNRSTPVDVMNLDSGVAAIAAGASHTCALLEDGTVQCWGRNIDGQLGDGSTSTRITPLDVEEVVQASAITAGLVHSCALVPGGRVQCWGDNEAGQLGDDTGESTTLPVYAVMDISQLPTDPTDPTDPEPVLFLPLLRK